MGSASSLPSAQPVAASAVGPTAGSDSALAARLADMLSAAGETRLDMEKDHALFQRIIIHRVQEARNVASIWRSGDVVDALRYLQTYAHESVAVDVLQSAGAFNDTMLVPRPLEAGATLAALDADGEGDGDGSGGMNMIRVRAVGGLPVWDYPTYSSIEWLEYACPVLEGLLDSRFEDYLSVAARAVGSALDAVQPLLESAAAECTAADLHEPPSPPPDSADAEGKTDGADAEAAAHWRRYVTATQAVQALSMLKPVAAALQRVTQRYAATRVAKLCTTRSARLQELRVPLQPLVAASAVASGGAAPP